MFNTDALYSRISKLKDRIAIRIQEVNKHFKIPINIDKIKPSEVGSLFLQILGFKPKYKAKDNVQSTITTNDQALRDISFTIEKGSVVCLVGPSGSGKSVLLSILAGVMLPTSGRIEINGLVSSLLNVGNNLDSQLTAYENIKKYQQTVHFAHVDTDSYMQEVIAFAELEGFIHVPVKTYSTGMRMRLSIALALHGQRDIFLIDDVLAVGDIAFQRKCVEHLHKLKSLGCTLVLILSDESLIHQLASSVAVFNNGRLCSYETKDQWLLNQKPKDTTDLTWQINSYLPQNDLISFYAISVYLDESHCVYLSLEFRTKVGSLQCRPLLDVTQGKVVLYRSLAPQSLNLTKPCQFCCKIEIPTNMLNDGTYEIMCGVIVAHNNTIYSLKAFDAVIFKLYRGIDSANKIISNTLFRVPAFWDVEQVISEKI